MKHIINSIITDSCMKHLESKLEDYHYKMRHTLKKLVDCEISEKDYIKVTADLTSDLILFAAKDSAANCEVVRTMH